MIPFFFFLVWKKYLLLVAFLIMPVSVHESKYIPSFSRKLLLLRRRDTVYTRSINGFSLRKFKVLSVGGSSLKWSKSIEKNSKKANEVSSAATYADNYFSLYSWVIVGSLKELSYCFLISTHLFYRKLHWQLLRLRGRKENRMAPHAVLLGQRIETILPVSLFIL